MITSDTTGSTLLKPELYCSIIPGCPCCMIQRWLCGMRGETWGMANVGIHVGFHTFARLVLRILLLHASSMQTLP